MKSASARVVAPAGQELRADGCNAFTPIKGGFSQTQLGSTHLARRQGAVAIRASTRFASPSTARPPRCRSRSNESARASCSISTTPSSTTAASCTTAGVRRAPARPIAWRRSTRHAVVETIRKTSKWFWDDPDRHREGRLQLEAARREVVRLALRELGIEDAELAACIGDAYSHRRDIGMAPLPDAIETVRWLRDRAAASRCSPMARLPPSVERLRGSSCGSLRRDSCRRGNGIRKARRARLQARAERARV